MGLRVPPSSAWAVAWNNSTVALTCSTTQVGGPPDRRRKRHPMTAQTITTQRTGMALAEGRAAKHKQRRRTQKLSGRVPSAEHTFALAARRSVGRLSYTIYYENADTARPVVQPVTGTSRLMEVRGLNLGKTGYITSLSASVVAERERRYARSIR